MHAWICENPVGVDALVWKELPTPQPQADEVRVAIRAASLNFPDILIVQNKYQMKPPLPFVPGSEYAGVVEAVGADVKHVKVGDAVAAFAGTGGFATHATPKGAQVMPLPEGFAFDDAAAFVLTYATTHHALIDRAQLKAGETVLVLGAAGGVGTAAIQIAKAVGARVIAAASSEAKLRVCKDSGADALINYAQDDLRARIKAITGGRGVDVVYDPVGGPYSEPALRDTAWNGRFLVVGFAAGDIPKVPLNLALLKGCAIVGVFWGAFTRNQPQDNRRNNEELLQMYLEGKIKPHIHATYPLERAAEALNEVMNKRVSGKVVLTTE